MKRIKLTVYLANGSEEIFLSKSFDENEEYKSGWFNYAGYVLLQEDGSMIFINPTIHRRIKIETVNE